MTYTYHGELTYDPLLGELRPGMVGEGPDDIVALKIRAGLLAPWIVVEPPAAGIDDERAPVAPRLPPLPPGRRAPGASVEDDG